MPNPTIGQFRNPQSLKQLAKRRNYLSQLTGFLLPQAITDYTYYSLDFGHPNTLEGLTATTGATATAFAASTASVGNSILRGQTGTTAATSGVGVVSPMTIYDAAKRPGIEVRFRMDVVTAFTVEIGFADPATSDAVISVTDIDVPTVANGVTDTALFTIDKSQTLTTAALVTDGTTASAAKTNISTFSPTANTFHTVLVQILGSNKGAFCIVDNNPDLSAVVTTGPDTGVGMRPKVLFTATDTNNKVIDIDYIRFWQDK